MNQEQWLNDVRAVTKRGFFRGVLTTSALSGAIAPYWNLKLAIAAIEDGNTDAGLEILRDLLPLLDIKL